jgi:rhodanese-related sulfurtransferase
MNEISVDELETMLAGDDPPTIVDVREPWELAVCKLPQSIDIPLGRLPGRLQDIPASGTVAVICHHGVRSLMAAQYLVENGIEAVSVSGGIDAWARVVEPGMPRY